MSTRYLAEFIPPDPVTYTRVATPVTAALQTIGSARTATPVTAAIAVTRTRTASPVAASLQAVGTPTAVALNPATDAVIGAGVVFVWVTATDAASRALHSRIIAAASPATLAGDGSFTTALADANSANAAGFEYDTSAGSDGSGPWVAYPITGLTAANQGRRARYTVTLPGGRIDWRVRLEAIT